MESLENTPSSVLNLAASQGKYYYKTAGNSQTTVVRISQNRKPTLIFESTLYLVKGSGTLVLPCSTK